MPILVPAPAPRDLVGAGWEPGRTEEAVELGEEGELRLGGGGEGGAGPATAEEEERFEGPAALLSSSAL